MDVQQVIISGFVIPYVVDEKVMLIHINLYAGRAAIELQ